MLELCGPGGGINGIKEFLESKLYVELSEKQEIQKLMLLSSWTPSGRQSLGNRKTALCVRVQANDRIYLGRTRTFRLKFECNLY